MRRIVCFMQSLLIYMLITPKKYLRATSKVVLDQTTGRRSLAKVTHEADQHRHDKDKERNTAYTDSSCFLNPPAETTYVATCLPSSAHFQLAANTDTCETWFQTWIYSQGSVHSMIKTNQK